MAALIFFGVGFAEEVGAGDYFGEKVSKVREKRVAFFQTKAYFIVLANSELKFKMHDRIFQTLISLVS